MSFLVAAASTIATTTAAAPSAVASSAIASAMSAAASSTATTDTNALVALVTTTVPSIVASALPSAITTTTPATSTAIVMPPYIDLSAAFFGGLVGGLTAVRRRFDMVGVVTLAVVGGLGGGILRDVLLQNRGIWALSSSKPILACLIAAFVASFFFGIATRLRKPLEIIGALSMGLFAVAGTDKAILAGLEIVPVILLGTMTAVGGSMVQAMLLDEVPSVLKPGTLTATAAVTGAALYALGVEWLNIVKPVALIVCVLFVVALRLLSIQLGWETPRPPDLSDAVVGLPKRLFRRRAGDESDKG